MLENLAALSKILSASIVELNLALATLFIVLAAWAWVICPVNI